MKSTSLRRKSFVSLTVALLLVFSFLNYSFAYVEEASWGVNAPFPVSKVFYNSDGSIKTMYTYYNQLNFTLLGNPSNNVNSNLTQVYLSKETSLGSGKYDPWVNANVETWGAVSASSVGGVFFSCPYYKVTLPKEGRYKVQVHTFDQNGGYLYSQGFNVLYSNSVVRDNLCRVVNDATADTAAFTSTNGYWSRVSFTVHDLSGQGVTLDKISLKLCNMDWMVASRGNASCFYPTDITITRSTVNADEYFVSATINATLFDNVAGEYYIECKTSNSNGNMLYSRMFPRLYIN